MGERSASGNSRGYFKEFCKLISSSSPKRPAHTALLVFFTNKPVQVDMLRSITEISVLVLRRYSTNVSNVSRWVFRYLSRVSMLLKNTNIGEELREFPKR